MKALPDILAQLARELSPERIETIARCLETMTSWDCASVLRSAFAPHHRELLADPLIAILRGKPQFTGKEIALAMRAAGATAALDQLGTEELLWTGPASKEVPIRRTEQALCELIDSATQRIFLVSYVVYRADVIIEALKNAIRRKVEIFILLEKSVKNGGHVDIDSIGNLNQKLPAAHFYIWSPFSNPGGASVHAKCAVSDQRMALITSSNLTDAAMESNMETGILVRNGNIPVQLDRHLQGLINAKILIPFHP